MKRRKPLSRSRIKRKPPRRLERPGADPQYVGWSHFQPCVGLTAIPGHICEGRIEFSHERHHTGLGLKAPDRRGVTKCARLHRYWEERSGPFAGWDRERRWRWMEERIIEQNARFEAEGYVFA